MLCLSASVVRLPHKLEVVYQVSYLYLSRHCEIIACKAYISLYDFGLVSYAHVECSKTVLVIIYFATFY